MPAALTMLELRGPDPDRAGPPCVCCILLFFFQAEDGIRDLTVTGVQTCALPISSYIHAGGKIGVLLELNCESDFVARTEDFKELLHDISMHIAATDPKYIRREDVTAEDYDREKEIYRSQAAATGKPAPVVEKIVEGKMAKFYEEVCLLDQPFIKEQTISVSQLIATKIGKLGENISVRRFARFKVGEQSWTIAQTKAAGSSDETKQ